MKRMLDCRGSDFKNMNGQELKKSILASEGRVIISEVIGSFMPLYPSVTNAELAAAFGADMILFNLFDVFSPQMKGLDKVEPDRTITRLKELTGLPVGVNLEPVDTEARNLEDLDKLPQGRIASEKTFQRVKELGFDYICLTGNPKTGVTNKEISASIASARAILGPNALIIAGKMHGAGVAGETGGSIVAESDLQTFIEAGADIILLPSPGTVPGMTVEKAEKLVKTVHENGALALLTIGTSQEGADDGTIRTIALNSKMAGADLYHIGDAGYTGVAIPENIMAYSIAVRGKRHTYVRMAASPLR
ncbi:PEP phosphonomutase [Bacillus marinisedimentorum]|uniref:DUF7916 family protein n=1 Tax=Bacillus marinisedimentorum TaxID=1821260 RepID=UPI0008727277|nr:PEP phosphonomutase [Bacillus marinisedimentorum]